MEADTELTRFLNKYTACHCLLTGTTEQAHQNYNYKQQSPRVLTQPHVIERGEDFVQVTIDLNGQSNTTDAGSTAGFSPIKWVLKNAKASANLRVTKAQNRGRFG
jgi:hypothetical protein